MAPATGKRNSETQQAPAGATEGSGLVSASTPSFAPLGLNGNPGALDPRASALGYPARRDRPYGPLPLRTHTLRHVQQIKKNALASTFTSRTPPPGLTRRLSGVVIEPSRSPA